MRRTIFRIGGFSFTVWMLLAIVVISTMAWAAWILIGRNQQAELHTQPAASLPDVAFTVSCAITAGDGTIVDCMEVGGDTLYVEASGVNETTVLEATLSIQNNETGESVEVTSIIHGSQEGIDITDNSPVVVGPSSSGDYIVTYAGNGDLEACCAGTTLPSLVSSYEISVVP